MYILLTDPFGDVPEVNCVQLCTTKDGKHKIN